MRYYLKKIGHLFSKNHILVLVLTTPSRKRCATLTDVKQVTLGALT
jgi:hypothetical protein